jgi:hypothetical protein
LFYTTDFVNKNGDEGVPPVVLPGPSADKHKNKINFTSFIGTEARYPSGRCTFEELKTGP